MTTRSIFHRAAVLSVALLGAACSSKSSKSDGGGTTTGACLSDKDCRAQGKLCDPSTLACVQCLRASDCGGGTDGGAGADCVAGACVAFETCKNSLDCKAGEVCDTTRGRCVACLTDTDCPSMAHCVASACHASCMSDKDCTAMKQLCDFTSASCVDCIRNSDCGTGKTCSAGSCTDTVCLPGSTSCVSNMLLVCSDTGSGYGSPITCPVACRMTATGGTCSDGSDAGGGGSDGPASQPDTSTSGTDVRVSTSPCGDPRMIDDMEDGDGYICRHGGLVGQWYTAGSTMVMPDQTLHPIPSAVISPPRDTSTYGMHMSAPYGYAYGGILGVDLQYDGVPSPLPSDYGVFNASQYTGIAFWVRATGFDSGLDVWVACAATTPSQYGGTCGTTCTDNYVRVAVTSDWSYVTAPFSALSGGSFPFNSSQLTHVQFRVVGSPAGAVDLWIDDLTFY